MQIDAPASQPGNLLQAYGPEGFKVNGELHASDILLSAAHLLPVSLGSVAAINRASLAPLLDAVPRVEILIVGTGKTFQPLEPALRTTLRTEGLSVDVMDTGAACRTVAILLSEGRRVGAALLLP